MAYAASLQGDDGELAAEWERRLKAGYWEIIEKRLVEGPDGCFRAACKVPAGSPLLFEASSCHAALGPDATAQMAQQLESHARKSEALELKSKRFTGESRSPLHAVLASNAKICSREPDMVALFVTCGRLKHSCCPNAFLDSTRREAVLRSLDDLPAGAEVFISYVPVSLGRLGRQAQLGQGYGPCSCPRCEDERTLDPQVAVLCGSCGLQHFSAGETDDAEQSCACGAHFVLADSLRHLAEARKANDFMSKDKNARGNELEKALALETRFRTASISKVIPLQHPQMLQLANNVANCYFYAAKSPGNNKDACWQGFWKYKHYYMDGLEANHGKTCQRDLHYLLSLRRMLLAKFSSAEESLRCRKTFQALCQLHFGESDLPVALLR